MQRSKKVIVLAAAAAIAGLSQSTRAATTYTWKNVGTDWNTAGSWTNNSNFPGNTITDIALFPNNAPGTNPTISNSVSIANVTFSGTSGAGYTIAAASGKTLTLNSTSTAAAAAIFAGN